jgi:hypothetical protein
MNGGAAEAKERGVGALPASLSVRGEYGRAAAAWALRAALRCWLYLFNTKDCTGRSETAVSCTPPKLVSWVYNPAVYLL